MNQPDNISINLKNNTTAYLPGSTLEGTLTWDCKKTPDKFHVILYWQIYGKGKRDQNIVKSFPIKPDKECGQRNLQIQLPYGPMSFQGKYMVLRWQIDVCIKTTRFFIKTNRTIASQRIVISHTGKEIKMESTDEARDSF